MIDLGTLCGAYSSGSAINNIGQVTGGAYTAGNSAWHAFLYSGNSMVDLGTLAGSDGTSFGAAINGGGQIVGDSTLTATSTLTHAIVYTDGVMYDLNSLLSNGLIAGDYLTEATAINDSDWIVANSAYDTAYLLNPQIDSPTP